MCFLEKIYTLNFAAQRHRTASALNFFCPRTRERKFLFRGVRWHTKNANVPYRLFSAFFYTGAHELVYLFFCLDAKEPKNQGKNMLPRALGFFNGPRITAAQA